MFLGRSALVLLACLMAVTRPVWAEEAIPEWKSEHFRDNALVGQIYATADKAFVSEAQLMGDAAKADYVLLGETHTNADHHLLQARVIAAMVIRGRRPTVVFEMIPADLSADLQAYQNDPDATAAELGSILSWSERGWPDWAIYQPIAEVALDNRLALRAGDLDTALRKTIGKQGLDALSADERARLALDTPLEEGLREDLSETLRVSHCGLLPEAAVGAIAQVQRARDAALADAMIAAGTTGDGNGAVLIAGRGHVRADYAAPWYLRARAQDAKIVTVGFVEVENLNQDTKSEIQALSEKAFDYLWFTPKSEVVDHCANLREKWSK